MVSGRSVFSCVVFVVIKPVTVRSFLCLQGFHSAGGGSARAVARFRHKPASGAAYLIWRRVHVRPDSVCLLSTQDSSEFQLLLQSRVIMCCACSIAAHCFLIKSLQVSWRTVFWGLGMQFCIGLFVIRTQPGLVAFQWLGDQVKVGCFDFCSK